MHMLSQKKMSVSVEVKNNLNSASHLRNIPNLAINKTFSRKGDAPIQSSKMAIFKIFAYDYLSLLRSGDTNDSENYKKCSHESVKLNGFVG